MVIYLLHKEIDKKRWDECINNAVSGNIYGFSWYLDHVCPGWDALVNDDYTTVMPLATRNKFLIDYIYPPYFSQQLGLYSTSEITQAECLLFLSAIPPKFQFIEMNLSFSNQWVPDSFAKRKLPDYILNLDRTYQEIRKGFSYNHERNVRKSTGHGLVIFKHASVDEVIKMFRENRGQRIGNLKNAHYEIFKALTEDAIARKMASIWLVKNKFGIPCAGAIFFESRKIAYFIFSSITGEGRKFSAMHFLIDSYIKEFAEKFESLDFEGSVNPDLARFYKGFGSKEFLYLQIKKNQLPVPWRWFKK